MKILRYIGLLLLLPMIAAAKESRIEELIADLEKLDVISGEATGYAAEPGEFFILSEEVIQVGTKSDFIRMTANLSPAVRVMGAYCLIQKHQTEEKESIEALYTDTESLGWNPVGCTILGSTRVGNIVKAMNNDPDILRWPKPTETSNK